MQTQYLCICVVSVCALYAPTDNQQGPRYIKLWYNAFPHIELHNLDSGHFGPLGDPDGFLDVYLLFLRTHLR